MSFNIEWTNADALTPSPFTVIRDGSHYEVKVDAHYVSDEEMQTLRRYIAGLNDENAKLRELCHDMLAVIIGWSWKFNKLAGHRLDDEDTYPSSVMRGFIDRARELEVPL